MTTNHLKVIFSSVTSRGAACGDLYRHQNGTTFRLLTSVAEDPSGATVCTTQWNKKQKLLYFLYNILIAYMRSSTLR